MQTLGKRNAWIVATLVSADWIARLAVTVICSLTVGMREKQSMGGLRAG
jgi:hypothetical protein